MHFFKRKKTIVTHNGSFHPDDVFACAALELLLERRGESWKVIRTRDPKIIASGDYVIDVGGEHDSKRNRFDHHQVGGAGKSGSDIPFASFGLVWKAYGTELAGSAEIAGIVEGELVMPIDASDNGIEIYKPVHGEIHPYTVQAVVATFQPSWKEEDSAADGQFIRAVRFAKDVLELAVGSARMRAEAQKIIVDAYNRAVDKRLIFLPESISRHYFQPTLRQYPEPMYAIYPKSSDRWGAEAIWKKEDVFGSRKPFPVSWAGLKDVDLQTVSGVRDAVFCHNGRFLVIAKSKEGAVALAQKALAA